MFFRVVFFLMLLGRIPTIARAGTEQRAVVHGLEVRTFLISLRNACKISSRFHWNVPSTFAVVKITSLSFSQPSNVLLRRGDLCFSFCNRQRFTGTWISIRKEKKNKKIQKQFGRLIQKEIQKRCFMFIFQRRQMYRKWMAFTRYHLVIETVI